MTTWQLIRWCLAFVSLATAVIAHLITVTVYRRRNGQSQSAILSFFAAVRLYAAMLAVNMAANAWSGRATDWALYLFAAANVWLLYSLVKFWVLIRGPRMPWVP